MTEFRRIVLAIILFLGFSSIAALAQDKIVLYVDQNDPKVMNLTLNNVQNLLDYYKDKGGIKVEVVTYGPGLHMLRKDTSPVKDRISSISLASPNVQFSACGNTIAGMTKQEGKKPEIVSEAKVVPAGIVRIIELEKQGYAYVKP